MDTSPPQQEQLPQVSDAATSNTTTDTNNNTLQNSSQSSQQQHDISSSASSTQQQDASSSTSSSSTQQHSHALEQTSSIIESLVAKRIHHLNYIKTIHTQEQEGKSDETSQIQPTYWMNITKISIHDMKAFYHQSTLQKRVEQWFFLGISLAPLLQLSNGWWFLRALLQLLEEYEYHFSNLAVQGMKYLKAMTSASVHQTSLVTVSGRSVKPSIQRVGGSVVYEFLRTPNVPCELDYVQVIYSLCDVLTFVYRKVLSEKQTLLQSPTTNHMDIREIIQKIDAKFKHEFFGLLSHDLNTLAMHMVKQNINDMEALLNENYNLRGEKKAV